MSILETQGAKPLLSEDVWVQNTLNSSSSPSWLTLIASSKSHPSWPPNFELTFRVDSQDVSYLQVIASQPQPSRSWERRLRPLLPAVDAAPPEPAAQPKENKGPIVSPFTIREELLCARVTPLYGRPEDGQVNGYVKFHWPSRNSSQQRSVTVPLPSGDDVEDATTTITPSHALDHNPCASTLLVTWHTDEIYPDGTVSLRNIEGVGARDIWTVTKRSWPVSSQDASLALTMGKPRLLPSEFGLEAKMNTIDRRLFEFCMFFLSAPWAFARCLLTIL